MILFPSPRGLVASPLTYLIDIICFIYFLQPSPPAQRAPGLLQASLHPPVHHSQKPSPVDLPHQLSLLFPCLEESVRLDQLQLTCLRFLERRNQAAVRIDLYRVLLHIYRFTIHLRIRTFESKLLRVPIHFCSNAPPIPSTRFSALIPFILSALYICLIESTLIPSPWITRTCEGAP